MDGKRVSESPESSQATPSFSRPRVILKLPKTPSRASRNFFVALPYLPAAQKRQYKPVNETSLNFDLQKSVNKVVGEFKDDTRHYYYAQFDGGIVYKFPAASFKAQHADLIEIYKKARSDGILDPFDPSAHYVHPLSRIKTRSTKSSRSEDEDVVPDSEPEDEETDEDEDDEDYDGRQLRKQPSRNASSVKKKELPFSPQKSTSRKVRILGSESDPTDESDEGMPQPTRRSSRARKATEINLVSDEDEYIDDYEDVRAKTKGKAKGKQRVKSAQPMYGHFRSIDTLDDDPFPDDEDYEALRRHRDICEKCHFPPAHKLLEKFKKKSKGKGKKRRHSTDDEFEESETEQMYINYGGWVQCLKCPVSAHWKCLAANQRDEVLKAVRKKDSEQWEASQGNEETPPALPKKRSQLEIDQITEFVCGACMRGGICMGCMEVALAPDSSRKKAVELSHANGVDINMEDGTNSSVENIDESVRNLARELLFRCFTCKRLAHYHHLPIPPTLNKDSPVGDIADHYQSKSWLCGDCSSYKYGLDKIIAWRAYPSNAVEPPDDLPNYKTSLPREYLVKWAGKSYRRVEWVPHMWLLSTHASKLKNFVSGRMRVELLEKPEDGDDDSMDVDSRAPGPLFGNDLELRASSVKPVDTVTISAVPAMPDAESRIPKAWKRVGRVLDVLLWRPQSKKPNKRPINRKRIESDDEIDSEDDDERQRVVATVFDKGEQPSDKFTESANEWEQRQNLEKSDIDQVVWAFIKWDELGYDEATWDAPPRPGEPDYRFFTKAFDKFIDSRDVVIPKQTNKYWEVYDKRNRDDYRKYLLKDASDLELGQDPKDKLMPFQVDGFNWLGNNWWNHQHCILADEMGLGKTVQIVSFLGHIAHNWNAFPALVVVPNSTITNWVREFDRWAPRLRVVPFYGEKTARDVIKKFELYHDNVSKENTPTKFHVLVTTYEALINGKDFAQVFKNQPRWEVLVVDEGQRLKSDSSLLFRKLNELRTIHRIIMTGTPLNNNMRELFNLMNFLDPREWKDLEGLEKQHEVLDEELIKQLHNRLRPYFLRRIKSEVLDLPPKNEVIVPISMASLQREVYRSILSNNINILTGLTQPSAGQSGQTRGRINNVLMQLRKCLQHPYLYAEDIEPRNLPPQETHDKLIDGSGKLRFLKALLPKLKEHGHRVLLFSQFVIALNIVEDFLQGEGYKFLRLDGGTKGSERQKAMDEFNKPNSDYFIFLLTTRAGGVGINLFTADTVIIFDPDFNPHQDLQAIARAYRYGQKKTCLVFKLMVKDSAEERIMQIGKKKLVLDHLIVQKMDDDEDNGGENVQSILTYGAQALFESQKETRDIIYTENDIEKLLEKTEKEAVKEAPKSGGGLSFSFAKIWAAEKDTLEDVVEDDQTDSWARTLQRINAERVKDQERDIAISGRGARRKAADIAKTKINVGARGSEIHSDKGDKGKQKAVSKSAGSDASAYFGSDGESTDDIESDNVMADEDYKTTLDPKGQTSKPKHEVNTDELVDCGLCGQHHGPGQCQMVDKSENLAEYREMLILHAEDEPWEERNAAIQAIDEILHKRGHLSLIAGQPLHPLPKGAATFVQNPPDMKSKPNRVESSNQASSSLSREPGKKKAKVVSTVPCILCGESPHLMKDCIIVLAGSKSISNHIRILEARNDPSLRAAIDILRNLLAKAKTQEMAALPNMTAS